MPIVLTVDTRETFHVLFYLSKSKSFLRKNTIREGFGIILEGSIFVKEADARDAYRLGLSLF